MASINLSKESILNENFRLFMFNHVMNKKDKFKLDEIVNDVKDILTLSKQEEAGVLPKIKNTLKELREDGFIKEKGSYYSVIELKLQ